MAVRAVARRRTYSPTDPVFAREDLKFSGRPVATRAQVPEDYFRTARARRVMWDARKIDHTADLPYKWFSAPSAAPAASPAATAQAAERAPLVDADDVSDLELERLTAPATTDKPKAERHGRRR